jgi:hypothetical protein
MTIAVSDAAIVGIAGSVLSLAGFALGWALARRSDRAGG